MRRRIGLTNLATVLAALFSAFATLSAGAQLAPENRPVSIPLLPPAQMSAADARIAVQSQEAVARSAQIYGYKLDSSYSYREIACPFAPHDLLLAYESISPNAAISRFSAVVSRNGRSGSADHSPVQIIPLFHFGIIPFVPASSSPHSIELFNQAVTAAPVGRALLSDMQRGQDPLVIRSLCYLAMIGVEPAALRSPSLDAATVHAPVPTLQFAEKGKTRQLISIRNSDTTYQVWTLTFSASGRLTTAAREEHPVEPATPVLLQAATPAFPSAAPVAANTAPAANPTLPQPAVASPPTPPAVPPPTPPTEATAAPPQPAAPPNTPPPAPVSAVPLETALIAATAASPQPAEPSANPTAVTVAATRPAVPPPSTAVVTSLPVLHRNLPEPPHRFIPDPPPPPSRIIPASALQSPPHLTQ